MGYLTVCFLLNDSFSIRGYYTPYSASRDDITIPLVLLLLLKRVKYHQLQRMFLSLYVYFPGNKKNDPLMSINSF